MATSSASVSACDPRESNRSRGRSSSGHDTMPRDLVKPVDIGRNARVCVRPCLGCLRRIPCPKRNGTCLLTSHIRHGRAFGRTLRARPGWGVLAALPSDEIARFDVDSSRSYAKSDCCYWRYLIRGLRMAGSLPQIGLLLQSVSPSVCNASLSAGRRRAVRPVAQVGNLPCRRLGVGWAGRARRVRRLPTRDTADCQSALLPAQTGITVRRDFLWRRSG